MSHPFTIKGNWENFDTNYYYYHYPDLQQACSNLNEHERKQWLLSHFYSHGFFECRRWRLKSAKHDSNSGSSCDSESDSECDFDCKKCKKPSSKYRYNNLNELNEKKKN